MDLEQLDMFIAVAEKKSFTAAARSLYISHSTVSRAVTALEQELGVKLIERDNHVAGLTAAGEIMLEEARSIIERLNIAAERVRAAAEEKEVDKR